MIIAQIKSSDIDPLEFERDSEAYRLNQRWNLEPLIDEYSTTIIILDPVVAEQMEQARRLLAANFREQCLFNDAPEPRDIKTRVLRRGEKQVKLVVSHPHNYCHSAFDAFLAKSKHSDIERALAPCLEESVAIIKKHILDELEAMLEEENEPDFMHSPTRYAYDLARQIIENTYTHYVASAPTPTVAPDGDGGLAVEWKVGRRVVRLIVGHDQNTRSYIYNRGEGHPSQIFAASGATLAEQLRSVFAG